jgi:hypothetical protein
MESFQPGLSFSLVSWADISSWPKDKILLKHSRRLHDKIFGPGSVLAQAENRHVID